MKEMWRRKKRKKKRRKRKRRRTINEGGEGLLRQNIELFDLFSILSDTEL